jgi:hypothetical protein
VLTAPVTPPAFIPIAILQVEALYDFFNAALLDRYLAKNDPFTIHLTNHKRKPLSEFSFAGNSFTIFMLFLRFCEIVIDKH